MKQRKFSNTGKLVSEVGLGTWQIGGSWGDVSDQDAMKILHAAADNGVTFYDTADVYGDGRSERLLGAFLKKRPADDLFVATKIGRGASPGWPENFTLDAMRTHVDAALERLGVETLNLVQLHCIPTEVMQAGEVFESLRTLQKEGKIQNFGASVESIEEAQICLAQPGLASLQIIFNLFRQKPIDELFADAIRKHVAIIVRLPLASGLLSGKMTHDTHFASTDHRNFNRDGQSFNVGETFAGLPFDLGVDLADELKTMLPAGMTMVQMALRWILDHEAVTTVIPGASRPEQVLSNVSASDLPPLSAELHAQFKIWYQDSVADHIRGKY
jgi:aryl-alcohol dehydrogenase-like predicted oxidoreductase